MVSGGTTGTGRQRLAAALLLLLPVPAALAGPPNVLVIIADDLGYNEVGFNGDSGIPTPRIDGIAGSGLIFAQAYANAPLCAPARAGLLLGDYPQRFGFEDNPTAPTTGLDASAPNLLRAFDDMGYRVGVFGKWHVGSQIGLNTPTDVGADTFFGVLAGIRSYFPGEPDPNRQIYRDTTNIEGFWGSEGDPALYDPVRGRYLTDALGEETAAFITAAAGGDEPFFALMSVTTPHVPIEVKSSDLALVPEDFAGSAPLVASIIAMDRAVGMALDAIDASGIAGETIVVFTNDNGGTGPGVADQDNGSLNGFKRSMYEGGIRVPLAIAGPGVPAGGFDAPMSLMDLAPTLVTMAGGTWTTGDGVDLSGQFSAGTQDPPREDLFFRWDDLWAVRSGDQKLVVAEAGAPVRLFDLAADIGETTDLLAIDPSLAQPLLNRLTRWEAAMDRIRWKPQTFIVQFDGYRFNPASGAGMWSDPFAWTNATGAAGATLTGRESFAGTRLFFPLTEQGYEFANDLTRATGLPFMLSRLTLEGVLPSAPSSDHRLDGLGLVFAAASDGSPATIEHAAAWPAGEAAVRLAIPLTVIDALELTGNGSGELVIEGGIGPLDAPAAIVKSGTSRVRISGGGEPGGDLSIESGVLALDDGSLLAALATVHPGATLLITATGELQADELSITGVLDLTGRVVGGPPAITLPGMLTVGDGATLRLPSPIALGDRLEIASTSDVALGAVVSVDPSPGGGLRWSLEVTPAALTAVVVCDADLAPPLGTVDFFDVLAFLALLDAGDPAADLAEPSGVLDFFDVLAFLAALEACGT